MTKSWEDIRPLACELYLSGKPLSEVQAQLQRVGFKASTRSFRSKFKQWGVTRASQLRELKEFNSSSTGRNTLEPDGGAARAGVSWVPDYTYTRPQSLPPEGRISDTEYAQQRLLSLRANKFSSIPDAIWSIRSDSKLKSSYEYLRSGNESQRLEVLEEGSFTNRQDNVLHYAAASNDFRMLQCIIDFMQNRSLSVDVLSSGCFTSLDIAIHMGRGSNVKVLLNAGASVTDSLETAIRTGRETIVKLLLDAGASVTRRNNHNQQPLHVAISTLADPDICQLLVDRGADVNFRYISSEHVARSPIHMALEGFLESNQDHEKGVFFAILQLLIDHGARIEPSDAQRETPLIKFINASTALGSTSSSNRQEQMTPSNLLGYYLNADQNPLCWVSKYHCREFQCETLAAFIFAHTPKTGLSAILIEGSDLMKYGLDLVRVLLTPCKSRCSNAGDPTVNELLGYLLRRMRDQNIGGVLRPGLLRQIVNEEPRKGKPERWQRLDRLERLERLETLLKWGYVSDDESREALNWLNEIDDLDFRLSFAELLLSRFNTALRPAYTNITTYLFAQKSLRFQDSTDELQLDGRLREQISTQLGITPTPENDVCILQCVVHVFTKDMIESKTGLDIAPAGVIIYVACRLRQLYQLPDISVAGHLLWELQVVTLHQNRHLSRALDSDSGDSPDSHMIDSAPYLTPESTRP